MAFIDISIDQLPESTNSYELLPAGWYTASITKAELAPTKDGSGQMIKLRYDITGPSHQGRVVFGNLNIKNRSAKAEEIGRQQLGEIMRAIGLARVTDTDQLIGAQLAIKVAIREAQNGYEAQNEVKGFKSAGGSAPAASVPSFAAPKPAQQAAAPAAATAPWLAGR
jgi:hypothetical protein